LKTGDKIVIALIVISLVVGLTTNYFLNKSKTRYLLIKADGEVFMRTPLYNTTNLEAIFVKSKEGHLYVSIETVKSK